VARELEGGNKIDSTNQEKREKEKRGKQCSWSSPTFISATLIQTARLSLEDKEGGKTPQAKRPPVREEKAKEGRTQCAEINHRDKAQYHSRFAQVPG